MDIVHRKVPPIHAEPPTQSIEEEDSKQMEQQHELPLNFEESLAELMMEFHVTGDSSKIEKELPGLGFQDPETSPALLTSEQSSIYKRFYELGASFAKRY